MEPGEYESLISKAGSTSGACELLLAMRTHKIGQPELVLLHGGRLLKGSHRRLGDDVWTIMEQVFLAAAELGAEGWREYCLGQLKAKFPNSTRVKRLKGINFECTDKLSEAASVYQELCTEKPEDVQTRKRIITLYKQKGNTADAIRELNKYLDCFCTDMDSWHELAELYIEIGSLQRAVFCFEELLLNNKHSMYHILTYAELLYTTGDHEHSRKYYSFACYLDGADLRALWGLLLANQALAEKEKTHEAMQQLQKFTIEKLKQLYKGTGPTGKAALALLDRMTTKA